MARSEQQHQPPAPQHELPLLQHYPAYDHALHSSPFYGQQRYAALLAQRLGVEILGPFATSNYLHNSTSYHPVPSVYSHLAATSLADATAGIDTAIARWQQPHERLLHSLGGGQPASQSSSLSQHWHPSSLSSYSPPQHRHELDYARYYGIPAGAANLHVHESNTEQKLSQHGHHHQHHGHHVEPFHGEDSLLLDSPHSRGHLPFFAPSHGLPSHPKPESMPKSKRPKRKKDQDEPKRPLTAYNIFFRDERVRLLKEAAEEAKSKSEAEAAEMKELSEEGKLDASARSAATNGSGKKVRRRRRRNGRETHGLMSCKRIKPNEMRTVPVKRRKAFQNVRPDKKTALEQISANGCRISEKDRLGAG